MMNFVIYVYIWYKCYSIPARSILRRIFSFSTMKRPSVAFLSPICPSIRFVVLISVAKLVLAESNQVHLRSTSGRLLPKGRKNC